MDFTQMTPLVELSTSLTELAVKGTVSKIHNKIKASKEEKNIEKLRTTYDEIINEILQEREDAIRIAQTYKSELERIVISDEDIKHLQKTVSGILEIIKQMSPGTDVNAYETVKSLITVDTLKTMQLLGFNYKAAIGEPLTELCAKAISNIANKNRDKSFRNKGR